MADCDDLKVAEKTLCKTLELAFSDKSCCEVTEGLKSLP